MRQSNGSETPHVVIVGGGFGGLYAARRLGGCRVRVTLVDRNNYHLFQPLLYQVATAALSPGEIAHPIRSILSKFPNVRCAMTEVLAIDLTNRCVQLAGGELHYDFLVLAAGATSTYFGHNDWEPLAPALKTIDDALLIRQRILCAFEAAELEEDEAKRWELLTFVVIGGGATGVELAGTIAEIARMTLKHDFRVIDPCQARVVLLQSGPRVLPDYPEDLSASAERQLKRLGVEVRTGSMVTGITSDQVLIGEEIIRTNTALWTAGVAASPLAKSLGVPLDRSGRVVVEADLTVPGHPEAYVIGDLASFAHQTGKSLPGIAPVAIQQGMAVAGNIRCTMAGRERRPFRYHDRGTMATIGRASAVANVKGRHLSGFFAWLAWMVVHLYFLVGFDNRLLVVISWVWSYFTGQRGARLITGTSPRCPG